jgi:hypothetical protein
MLSTEGNGTYRCMYAFRVYSKLDAVMTRYSKDLHVAKARVIVDDSLVACTPYARGP